MWGHPQEMARGGGIAAGEGAVAPLPRRHFPLPPLMRPLRPRPPVVTPHLLPLLPPRRPLTILPPRRHRRTSTDATAGVDESGSDTATGEGAVPLLLLVALVAVTVGVTEGGPMERRRLHLPPPQPQPRPLPPAAPGLGSLITRTFMSVLPPARPRALQQGTFRRLRPFPPLPFLPLGGGAAAAGEASPQRPPLHRRRCCQFDLRLL